MVQEVHDVLKPGNARDTRLQRRFLVAGYGLPAEFGLMSLFAMGVAPDNIALLTHPSDSRNVGLRSLADLRKLRTCDAPAKSPETLDWVRDFAPDLLISLHYRSLVPRDMLQLLPLGGVNLHPSLLPNYRGTNSVAWVLINGEPITGFTFHRMDERFDTGNILLQDVIPIEETDTAFSLFHRQIIRSMGKLEGVIGQMLAGDPGIPQSPGGSYYPRALPHNGLIDPAWDRGAIDRFIRAMHFPPFSPAAVVLDGQTHTVESISEYLELTGSKATTPRR